MNILAQETWIDVTNPNCRMVCGDTHVYETFTSNKGELYRALLREYGRCIGKVYVNDFAVGWVFLKRQKYENCNGTFLRETWVTLHKDEPVERIEYDYMEV